MPDRRRHRGPHPEDEHLFRAEAVPRLRSATADLSWLLTRGYADKSSLKLVGDRFRLNDRQRLAVARCACGDDSRDSRERHRLAAEQLRGQALWIDGFNVITSMEAALAGGVILKARDGCYRDMASMHGSYRRVDETLPAIRLIGETISRLGVTRCRWLLDQPVSNSGRLAEMLRQAGEGSRPPWVAEVVADPDPVLIRSRDAVVASSDSHILDHASRWFNLARLAIDSHVPEAWFVDVSSSHGD